MAGFTSEERNSFCGSITRDAAGVEHLFGLTSAETDAYLSFRRNSLSGAPAIVDDISKHIRLYERHRHACKVRRIEPSE